MAFVEVLSEMLSKQQLERLSQEVAIINVERHNAGEPKKFLNLCRAEKGVVEWSKYYSDACTITKIGKFEGIPSEGVEGLLSKVEDQIGLKGKDWKYVRAEQIRQNEYEPSAIGGEPLGRPTFKASSED